MGRNWEKIETLEENFRFIESRNIFVDDTRNLTIHEMT